MKGIFQLKENKIVFANQNCADLLKIDLKQLIGLPFLDISEGVQQLFFTNILNHLNIGELEEYQSEFQLKNGHNELGYYTIKFDRIINENNENRILGTIKANLSNPKEIENYIKIDRRYNSLLFNTLDGVYIYDYINEYIVDANSAAVRILKYDKKEELVGLPRSKFVPESSPFFPGINLLKYTDTHGDKVKRGESFSTHGIFKSKDGSQVLVKARVVPTFHKYGEGFVMFQDVTDVVQAQKALKSSGKKYRYVFENSHEAIVYLDLKSQKITICNDNALSLFGASNLEEFQKISFNGFYLEREDEKAKDEEFAALIQKTIAEERAEVDFWIKSKLGEIKRVKAVLVSDTSDKRKPRIVAFIRDITSLHEAQLALENKNTELEKYIASNLELENFAYFASHDLQTPLRSIISFTQLLQHSLKGKISVDQQDYMDFIISSGKNMKTLVDDLLTYSRVNTTEIEREEIDLNKIFVSLCADLRSLMEERNVKIDFINVPGKVYADDVKIKQVFQNLFTNAIKFTKAGVEPNIQINARETEEFWYFTVKDNGIGIAPEFQDKIFGMFKRLHTSEVYEGTGIGLAIVKKIIEQHNGEITLESKLGFGSTFSFTIAKELKKPNSNEGTRLNIN